MSKKVSISERRKLSIMFIDVARSYDANQDIELRYSIPKNFIFGANDKIILERIGSLKNEILLECKTAKHDTDSVASYVVNIKKGMFSNVQNDDDLKYRFIYKDTKNEIIGASLPFTFSAIPTPSINVLDTINELGNILFEESSEKEEIIRILADELDNTKQIFKKYYNNMNSMLHRKVSSEQFEDFLSKSNSEKEKKIDEMTEKFIKLKISSSDIILREIKITKDDVISKISGENNKLYNLILNEKKNWIPEENTINNLANEISSQIEKMNNSKLNDIYEKINEINDRISQLNYFHHEKISEDMPNNSDITLDGISSESLSNQSENTNSKIAVMHPENSSFEIKDLITVNNSSSTENVIELKDLSLSKVFNSTPICSNSEKKAKLCPVCSYIFLKENIREMYLHVESHYFGSEKDINVKSKI